MEELRHYRVSPYTGLYEIHQEIPVKVTIAASPEIAAEMVLGERLVRFGRVSDLRAKVSFEVLDGKTKTVLLYRLKQPPAARN